jgi:hypothetical protein
MTKKRTLTALQRAIKAKRTGSREHKYRAKPTEVDGIKFASKKEAHRYKELQLLQRAGKIAGLRKQVAFPIVINTRYIADFVYLDLQTGLEIVEDVKGYRTGVYKQKKKLMLQQHGIEIKES